MPRSHLRPFERAVLRLSDAGMPSGEIAWRFRRSPGHIDRVLDLSRMPDRALAPAPSSPSTLRPVERQVRRARLDGVDLAEIAARMRRSPSHVDRVDQYASYKLAQAAAR